MNKGILGDYVELIRKKNRDLVTDTLVGVDISKNLIEQKVKGEKTDLKALQLVEKGNFVMSGMNVGRDKRVPIALYTGDKILGASGSNKYYIFKVKNPKLIISEFLNLIFKSRRIDLQGLYLSGKGVRGELEWENFCSIQLSLPPLEVQLRIVSKYQSLERVIQLKKEINDKLETWMQSLFHVWFDELKEFTSETFGSLFQIVKGGRPPRSNEYLDKLYFCKERGIPSLTVSDINRHDTKFVGYVEEYLTEGGFKKSKTQIIKAQNLLFVGGGVNAPQLGKVKINFCNLTTNSTLWALLNKPKRDNFLIPITFSYFLVKENIFKLKNLINSSTDRVSFDLPKFERFEVKLPPKHLIEKFNQICSPIFELQKQNELIITKCQRLQKCIVETLN